MQSVAAQRIGGVPGEGRNGSDEGPVGEVEDTSHGIDQCGEACVVHTPEEGAEVGCGGAGDGDRGTRQQHARRTAEGAVAVAGEEGGGTTATGRVGEVDDEVGERLAHAAELAFVNIP
jgi:hypothetical protein